MSVTRTEFAEGLRALADHIEEVPELPIPEQGVLWFGMQGPDLHAFAELDRAAKALAAGGLPFEAASTGASRFVQIRTGPITYRVSRVQAPAWDIAQLLVDAPAEAVR